MLTRAVSDNYLCLEKYHICMKNLLEEDRLSINIEWLPMMIPAPWYPHTCVVFSQIIPGLDFVANSIWCKWCYVTSDMNLYKTVGSIFGVLSLDLGSHTLEKAKSWAGLWRSPPGKDLRPPSNTPLRVIASTFGSLWYVHP